MCVYVNYLYLLNQRQYIGTMESQYQQSPVRQNREIDSGVRQAGGFLDNRPSFAAQRKMIEGMGTRTGVIQRVCGVTGIVQTDCNCGLTCVMMAVRALRGIFSEADYDKAAEDSGSAVGEIFSFDVMRNIVEALPGNGFTAARVDFTDADGLKAAIGRSGANPTLIAFSNLSYKTARGVADAGSPIHTQRGHWSVIQAYDDVTGWLTMMNPNSGANEYIQLSDMLAANQSMGGTPGTTPQFDWTDFTGDSYLSMEDDEKYTLSPVTGTTFTRSIAGGATSGPLNVRQNLDLAGYIVVISLK